MGVGGCIQWWLYEGEASADAKGKGAVQLRIPTRPLAGPGGDEDR